MSRSARAILAALCALSLALAAALVLYPGAAKLYDGWRASQQRSSMEAAYVQAGPEAVEAAIGAAAEANASLAAGGGGEEGADALDADGSGIISWLEIPKLGLEVPVYRSATDEALMAGAARVEGTSLPVGGESSNVVVAGHSGMVYAQMFDRLDELAPGDEVVFWTLGRPFAYRVTASEVVEPEEAEEFSIREGADLAELVTCRPIGVNSHRLVVRAQRCPYEPDDPQPGESSETPRSPLFWAALAICALLPLLLAALLAACRRRTWWLVRTHGAHPLRERDVARLSRDAKPLRLDLKRGGEARLRMFGEDARGTWERDRDDVGQLVVLDFEQSRFGPYTLPEGSFVARSERGELRMWVDGGANVLVFMRRRPRRHARRAAGRVAPGAGE